MAARAERLIAPRPEFRLLCVLLVFFRLFGSCAGLRLAPLKVFAERSRQTGFFSGVRRIGLFVHKIPVSRAAGGFKLCLRAPDPYGKPCPRGAIWPANSTRFAAVAQW